MTRMVALDFETTGFCEDKSLNIATGHRIIEIGCVEIIGRRITGKQFHICLNPEMEVDKGATKVNGLIWAMLKDKPKFSEVAGDFLHFIGGSQLIIHNALFDMSFIRKELSLMDREYFLDKYMKQPICTKQMAQKIRPSPLKNSLDDLCKVYGVDNSNRSIHGALLDAKLLAQVYLAMTVNDEQSQESVMHTESKDDRLMAHLNHLITKHSEEEEVVLLREIKDFVEKL